MLSPQEFKDLWQGLLKGLNLVRHKAIPEGALTAHFPEHEHLWRPHLPPGKIPRPSADQWRALELLALSVRDLFCESEAELLLRRLRLYAQYSREHEKQHFDGDSLRFFLGPLTPELELRSQLAELTKHLPEVDAPPLMTAQQAIQVFHSQLGLAALDREVKVLSVPHSLSKAATGKDYIRLSDEHHYSERDVAQLFAHEALVHLRSNLAGAAQRDLFWLSSWSPAITAFQEGLALVSELATGAMDAARWRRLQLRHDFALCALKGRSARDCFAQSQREGLSAAEAMELVLRIYRGSSLEGGMCFPKELLYLKGLELWLSRRGLLTPGDVSIALVGKMDFLEWDLLRSKSFLPRLNLRPLGARDPLVQYLVGAEVSKSA